MNKTTVVWCTIDELFRLGVDSAWFAGQLKKIIIPSKYTSSIVVPVVAEKGYEGNDFAAYIGFPEPELLIRQYAVNYASEAKHTPEGCARHGDKISKTMARLLFPEMKDYVYRS